MKSRGRRPLGLVSIALVLVASLAAEAPAAEAAVTDVSVVMTASAQAVNSGDSLTLPRS